MKLKHFKNYFTDLSAGFFNLKNTWGELKNAQQPITNPKSNESDL